MTYFRTPGESSRRSDPSLSLGSSGPMRVDSSTPDPEYKAQPVGFAQHYGSNSEARKREHPAPEVDPWVPILVKWVNEGGELNFEGIEVPQVVQDMLEAYHYYPKNH